MRGWKLCPHFWGSFQCFKTEIKILSGSCQYLCQIISEEMRLWDNDSTCWAGPMSVKRRGNLTFYKLSGGQNMPQIWLLPMSLSSVFLSLLLSCSLYIQRPLKIVPLLKIFRNLWDFDLFIFLLLAIWLSLTIFWIVRVSICKSFYGADILRKKG